MPRFTLRQLLTGVFLGCVYFAVIRDVFMGVPHDAVAMVAWVTLAVFYFRMRLKLTLVFHGMTPLAMILSALLFMLLELSTNSLSLFCDLVVFTCIGSSLVIFPLAIVGLFARYLKKRRKTPSGTESMDD